MRKALMIVSVIAALALTGFASQTAPAATECDTTTCCPAQTCCE